MKMPRAFLTLAMLDGGSSEKDRHVLRQGTTHVLLLISTGPSNTDRRERWSRCGAAASRASPLDRSQ